MARAEVRCTEELLLGTCIDMWVEMKNDRGVVGEVHLRITYWEHQEEEENKTK